MKYTSPFAQIIEFDAVNVLLLSLNEGEETDTTERNEDQLPIRPRTPV